MANSRCFKDDLVLQQMVKHELVSTANEDKISEEIVMEVINNDPVKTTIDKNDFV